MAMPDVLRAFGSAFALDGHASRDGDGFYVRYQQAFTLEGEPIGIARVLWAELHSLAHGTVATHRYRTRDGVEQFWLTGGQAAISHSIDLPLDTVGVSSAFGPRADPFGRRLGMAAARVLAKGGPRSVSSAFMHSGVDLAAPSGTPVYAASAGVVLGARPNGGYGNWIQIDHPEKLSTVYAHLSRFAPGLKAGAPVRRGELIGFVGSTGRSTGPHLHFELLADGAPVDPIAHPLVGYAPLRGPELERFGRQVSAALAERDREAAFAASSPDS